MGKLNNALIAYLSDNVRYADFYNGICFGGRQKIKPEGLVEMPGRYMGNDPQRRKGVRREYTRDLLKCFCGSGIVQICAVELQETVDYTMP